MGPKTSSKRIMRNVLHRDSSGKRKLASKVGFFRLISKLARDESGSYLLLMSVVTPILVGFAGLATEGSLTFYNHRALQSAADAAAYSSAIAYSLNTNADMTTQAKAIVSSYNYVVGTGADQVNVPAPTVINSYGGSPYTAIQVTISRQQTRLFSSIWSNGFQTVSASAVAVVSGATGGGGGQCMLSLAPTGTGISLGGTDSIIATDCGVFSNSTSSDSLSLNGTPNINAASIGTAGGVSAKGSYTLTPAPTVGDGQQTDPYAGNSLPPCAGSNCGTPCTAASSKNPVSIKGKGTVTTLQPGRYCGGISVDVHSTAILSPGTYFIDSGTLSVASGAALTGAGVTIVYTSSQSPAAYPSTMLDITSKADISLTAPAANANAGVPGMLMIGDNNMPITTQFNLQANSVSSVSNPGISGVIYMPKGNFTWYGGPILNGTGCTQFIAYTISLQGNSQIQDTGCNFPSATGSNSKPIGSVVTLVN